MSGRKTFTAGEVLQAADVNDYLMDQSVMVFAGTAARGSAIPSPTEGMVTYLEDSNAVEVYNGSAFTAVGPGSILQVVSTTKTDTFTTTSSTFVDVTSFSVSITPSSTSSKIFVSYDCQVGSATGSNAAMVKLLRDATPVLVGDVAGSRDSISGAQDANGASTTQVSGQLLDSPSTTSAITYKLQIRSNVSGQLVGFNRSKIDTDSITYGRTASTITLMEVAG